MSVKRSGRILLVEDEAGLRRLIARFLGAEGFEVTEAGNGREGLDHYASRGPFGLVMLDLDLPLVCGAEVCRRIKAERPEQPVIICSAAILDEHLATLRSFEAIQFLSKPYHPAELLGRVRAELARNLEPRRRESAATAGAVTWRGDGARAAAGAMHALFKQPAID